MTVGTAERPRGSIGSECSGRAESCTGAPNADGKVAYPTSTTTIGRNEVLLSEKWSNNTIENWFEDRFGKPVEEDRGPQRYFSPTVQGTFFSLPGTGSPGTECGEDVQFWCNECHEWFQGTHNCGERQCPHCSGIWVRNQARLMKGRLWDGRDYYNRETGEKYRLHHVIVSYRIRLPDSKAQYRDLRRSAYELARQAGIEGGCVVFHPWRESRDKDFDVVGPHFHILGLGHRITPDIEVEPYTTDIIFKRVRDFDARQIEPFEYVLTHCGIAEGCHAIVWFGNLAYNKMEKGPQELRAQEKAEPEAEICPHCGSNNTTYVDMREVYGFIQRHPAGEGIPPKEM